MVSYANTEGILVKYNGETSHIIYVDTNIHCDINKHAMTFSVIIRNNKLEVRINHAHRWVHESKCRQYCVYDLEGIINVKYDYIGVYVIYADKIIHISPLETTYYTKEPLTPYTQVIRSNLGIAVSHDHSVIEYGLNDSILNRIETGNRNYVLIKINKSYTLVFNDDGVITCDLGVSSYKKLFGSIYIISFYIKENAWHIVDFDFGKYVKITKFIQSCIDYCSDFEFYGDKLLYTSNAHNCTNPHHKDTKRRYVDCFNKYNVLIPDDFDFDRNVFIYSPPIKSARKV